jgi:mRNA interferase MazF
METTISIPATLLNQAEILAQQLNVTQDQLFERALAEFIRTHKEQTPVDEADQAAKVISQVEESAIQKGSGRKRINQGDIYWVQIESSSDQEIAIPHPHVVIQDNLLNHSRIHTVVTCALTSNIKRVSNTPGNLLLDAGEGNLPKQSVVEVSKVSTVEKSALGEYIGSLSARRIKQIFAGMRFLQISAFDR